MSSDVLIRVRGLGKTYRVRRGGSPAGTSAREALIDAMRRRGRRQPFDEFHALRSVDFDVNRGEAVAIVGRNGAGKSTILKILSRVTAPTSGAVDLYGTLGSLLEVGTGFHNELTGRENIFLNGAILGMSRRHVTQRLEAIVDFAGVHAFLDTPVKRYSSGMQVRLAFAVAAHLETDALLVDEVLAVGDAEFQRKCLGKMSEIESEGRAVIFVSHDMAAVRQLTQRAILLQAGEVIAEGTSSEIVERYLGSMTDAAAGPTQLVRQWDYPRDIEFAAVSPGSTGTVVGPDDPIEVVVELTAESAASALTLAVVVESETGRPVGASFQEGTIDLEAGPNTLRCRLPDHRLAPGRYALSLSIGFGDRWTARDIRDAVVGAFRFEVTPEAADGGLARWGESWGSVRLPSVIVARD